MRRRARAAGPSPRAAVRGVDQREVARRRRRREGPRVEVRRATSRRRPLARVARRAVELATSARARDDRARRRRDRRAAGDVDRRRQSEHQVAVRVGRRFRRRGYSVSRRRSGPKRRRCSTSANAPSGNGLDDEPGHDVVRVDEYEWRAPGSNRGGWETAISTSGAAPSSGRSPRSGRARARAGRFGRRRLCSSWRIVVLAARHQSAQDAVLERGRPRPCRRGRGEVFVGSSGPRGRSAAVGHVGEPAG